MSWRARPVFISSTFSDMQAERDYLRAHVFPAIEERLLRHKHHLEWVDLRLGVPLGGADNEHQTDALVLKVCFNEIAYCRPLMLVILGDRYGWIPDDDLMELAAQEHGFQFSPLGKSVTDIEIRYGAFVGDASKARFYFRAPLPYDQMPPEIAEKYSEQFGLDAEAPVRAAKLNELKTEIQQRYPTNVTFYKASWNSTNHQVEGLDDWGRQVIEDLWESISRVLPAATPGEADDWLRQERQATLDYAELQSRDFVGREDLLAELDAYIVGDRSSDAAAYCIVGGPGAGKSALFGALVRRHMSGTAVLLAHSAVATPRAPYIQDVLVRLIGELQARLNITSDDARTDTEALKKRFLTLLATAAQHGRVILIIDALDQLEDGLQARDLRWLVDGLPVNARLIMTCTPCGPADHLLDHPGVRTHLLRPLVVDEATEIIQRVSSRYRRAFDSTVVGALLSKPGDQGPAHSNPLWLTLAVEEINLLGAEDFAVAEKTYTGTFGARLNALIVDVIARLPPTIEGLYHYSFKRAEHYFGNELTSAFLHFLLCSTRGLRESDLRGLFEADSLLRWDELSFASLRRLFRGQLRREGRYGLINFTHHQMRNAVATYLAAPNDLDARRHRALALHFSTLPADDPLHISETITHILGAHDAGWAARYYANDNLTAAEIEGASEAMALAARSRIASSSPQLSDLLSVFAWHEDDEIVLKFARRAHFAFREKASERLALSTRAVIDVALCQQVDALLIRTGETLELLLLLNILECGLGAILARQGKLSDGIATVKAAAVHAERLAHLNTGEAAKTALARAYHQLGLLYQQTGELAAAAGEFEFAVAMYTLLLDFYVANASPSGTFDLAGSMIDLAQVRADLKEEAEALSLYQSALDLVAPLQESHVDAAHLAYRVHTHRNILWQKIGKPERGAEDLRAGKAIIERLAGDAPDNKDLQRDRFAVAMNTAASLLSEARPADALEVYRKALREATLRSKADPTDAIARFDVATVHNNIASVLFSQDELPEAREYADKACQLFHDLAQANQHNAEWQDDAFDTLVFGAHVRRSCGDLEGALEWYALAGHLTDRISQNRDRRITEYMDCVADTYVSLGRMTAALSVLEQLVVLADRYSSGHEPGYWRHVAGKSLSKLGFFRLQTGDISAAEKAFARASGYAEQLVGDDPSNPEYIRLLAVAVTHLADANRDRGLLAEAWSDYCKAHEMFVRQAAATDEWQAQSDLAFSHSRRGTVLLHMKNNRQALTEFERAREVLEGNPDKEDPETRLYHALAFGRIAEAQTALNEAAEARAAYTLAIEQLQHLHEDGCRNEMSIHHLMLFRRMLAQHQ